MTTHPPPEAEPLESSPEGAESFDLPAKTPSKAKAIVLSVVAVLVVVGGIGAIKASQIMAMIESGESYTPPPIGVTTAEAREVDWENLTTATGTAVANQMIMVASEIPGRVSSLRFESGQLVSEGDVLATLDASLDRASLVSARAQAELATTDLGRTETLVQRNARPAAELDAARARRVQADANSRSLRVAIGKRTIRAPFGGRLGIREVDLGEVVGAGTPIVSLQNLDPMFVDFRVPDTQAARIQVGHRVRVRSTGFEDALEGTVEVIDPQVDPATRSVRIRATVPNPQERIRAGMFLDVETVAPSSQTVLVIPNTAVLYAPYGNSVYVVSEGEGGLVAEQVFVRLGDRRGDLVAVEDGLEAGQTVVSTGAFKLQNGAGVVVENEVAPPDAVADPDPEDQ